MIIFGLFHYYELFWFELISSIALAFLFGLILTHQIVYTLNGKLKWGMFLYKVTPKSILTNSMWVALFLTTKSYILFGICFTLLLFMLYNVFCSKKIAG